MARIISVVNQKGGVGKTTTAVNLATYLARLGKWVLLVDLDPQANATAGIGVDYQKLDRGLYQALSKQNTIQEVIFNTRVDGLKIAPATIDLAAATVELVNEENREFRLSHTLDPIKNGFDYIFIDCPPSLGLLTINALTASGEVLIPVQSEYYSLEGLGQLLNTVNLVKENLKPNLDILGAVLTMYDRRARLSNEVMMELYKYFPNRIFRSVIPRNVRLAEAPSHGKPISEYAQSSKGARAYEKLAKEIIDTE